MWGTVLKRDLLGETREEDKFHSKEQLMGYLRSEIEKQGENVSIRNLDVSLLKDLSNLFYSSLVGVKTLDLSGWKTSGVKDMRYMFHNCQSLESLDLSGWDTSSVRFINHTFYFCKSLKSLDLSSWNTSNVKDMSLMFYYCANLESLDLSGWDTSNVGFMGMTDMFTNCPAPYKVRDNKIVKK